MAFAVAGVWFAGLYQDWLSGVDALLLGVAVAFAAPVGDLFESLIKRDAGAKDTGSMLGPHGGRWTASTRCCSACPSRSTSGTR